MMMISWINDNPVSFVLFLASFFCLFQALFLKKDFFSPANIYCFSQCITLAVAYLKLDYAMTDFKLKTWLLWIGAMVSFCGGCLFVRLVAKQKALPVGVHPPVLQYGYNWKLHVLFSFGAFLFFLVGVGGILHTAGHLLVFDDSPGSWMTQDSKFGYFPLFYSSSPLAVFLFTVSSYSRFNPVKSLRIISRIMVFLVIVLAFMAYPNRTSLFFSLGFIIISFNFLSKRISPGWIVLGIVLVTISFVAIGSLRNQYTGTLKNASTEFLMLLIYRYVVNNYWILVYAVNAPTDREYHSFTYGIDFFSGIFEYTGMSGALKRSYRWDSPFQESIQKIAGLNTVSYLWELYKDFGALGAILIPLVCGIALALLYLQLGRPFGPRSVALYSLLAYFVMWSFFSSFYKQGMYWFWLIAIYFVCTVCMKYLPLPANSPILDKVADKEECQEHITA